MTNVLCNANKKLHQEINHNLCPQLALIKLSHE